MLDIPSSLKKNPTFRVVMKCNNLLTGTFKSPLQTIWTFLMTFLNTVLAILDYNSLLNVEVASNILFRIFSKSMQKASFQCQSAPGGQTFIIFFIFFVFVCLTFLLPCRVDKCKCIVPVVVNIVKQDVFPCDAFTIQLKAISVYNVYPYLLSEITQKSVAKTVQVLFEKEMNQNDANQ